ncbi:Crp/Fnr family transcriptional regulator [Clostridium aciditolerans]|uniref:Crp/Fnr family transcriptional regulator n=1 Tax=Clostridium aciditolerans TaxID=339861 RepID=A0A934HU33_9CLOT|nr:Crp/Fnr family transcriptional regulator [Clostridium aciditolerans]MBI6871434.1 Crp/Fnr family transcriptional regulator [Clostridium aciditolerans]
MSKVTYDDFNQLTIFNNLDETTRKELRLKSSKIKLKKGQILFSERDDVDKIYIVLSGKVTMFRNSEEGQKRVIYILSSGEFINEVIFDNVSASINCEAFEDSYIVYLNKNDLLEIMSKDFNLSQIIINSMSRKIRRLYRQLKNTVPIKMDKKVAAKLWKLCRDYGMQTEDGVLINLNISITYLADMLGSTRETISRCINNFEKIGIIKFLGKKIIVRDPEELSLYFKGR